MNVKAREERRELKVFSSVSDLAGDDLIRFLEQCAVLLPEEVRFRLREVMKSVPHSGDNLQRVLELVRRQWEGLQSEESVRIAVIGPAGAGKSTLVRSIVGDEPEESPPLFTIADLQGLEEFLGYGSQSTLEGELQEADMIWLVLDAHYRFTEDTMRMVRRFASRDKKFVLILNKIDRASKPRRVISEARKRFGTAVIPTSAFRPSTVTRLLKAVVAAYPKSLFPLARKLPEFRRTICRGIVTNAAFGAGVVGAIPLPVSDLLPISAVQIAMLLKIARVHGFEITRGRARELLPLLAAGYLVHEGTHALRERFPDQKTVISISSAGLWTYLVGQASIGYFERLSSLLEKRSS